jgi:hypothetical protein
MQVKSLSTDADFQAEILLLTKTKCLIWLQEWCDINQVSRTHWKDLYSDVLIIINGQSDRHIRKEVFSCVQEEINEIERKSTEICDLFGWIVIPSTSGFGSHEVFDGNILLETIFQCGNGFQIATSKSKSLHGDRYSAALSILPAEVIQNKASIKRLQRAFSA